MMKTLVTQQFKLYRLPWRRPVCTFSLILFVVFLQLCSTTSFAWAAVASVRSNGANETVSTGNISLQAPAGVVIHPNGTLYIADTGAGQVLKIAPGGNVSTLAITGLTSPKGLALDNSGNLYIVDSTNNKVIKVTPDGAQSNIDMGSITLTNPYGIAVDASNNIYLSEPASGRILIVPSTGSASAYSITTTTPLNNPSGLATDRSGNLYIADKGNDRIVKVIDGTSTEIASGASFSGPTGVAIDNNGNLYVCNETSGLIEKIDSGNNVSSYTLYGYTLATPGAVAVDPFGTLYIADTGNNQIRKAQQRSIGFGHLNLGSTTPTTLSLQLAITAGMQIDTIQLLTAGTASQDFKQNGATTCTATTYNSTSTCTVAIDFLPVASGLRQGALVVTYHFTNPSFSQGRPASLTSHPNTSIASNVLTVPLYGIADASQAILSPSVASVISTGTTSIGNTYQVAVDGSGNIYAGSYMGATVYKIPAGGGSPTTVSTGTYTIGLVTGIALDSAGNLYIADHDSSVVLRVTASGTVTAMTITASSRNIFNPTGLALDVSGDVYVADYGSGRVVKFTPPTTNASTATVTGTVVNFPGVTFNNISIYGVSVDSLGNIYTADAGNVIYRLSPAGVVTTITPTGLTAAISSAGAPVVDSFGNISLTDINNSRLISLANNFSGSLLSVGGLNNYLGMAFTHTIDANGNIYYPDWGYGRIVFVQRTAGILSFSSTTQGFTSSDSPKSVVVTNKGTLPLTFSAATSYPNDFVQNSTDTNPCSLNTSLSFEQTCNVAFKFTPQTNGTLTETATITNNNANQANATQQITLKGESIYPGDTTSTTVAVTPSGVTLGSPVSITVTVSDTTTGKTSTAPTGSVTITDTPADGSKTTLGGGARSLSNGSVTLSNVILQGAGAHAISATYAGILHSFLASANSTRVTVKAIPTITLATNTNPILITNAITFTATVASTPTTPTGNVIFYDGTTALGTVALTNGVAAFTTSSLAAATHSITATYLGNMNFTSVTSSTIAELVQDYTLSIGSSSGGSTGGSGASAPTQTVLPGGTATFTLALDPSNGGTFPAPVMLSVTGVPTGGTAILTPAILPAGSSLTNVTLTVTLPKVMANAKTTHTPIRSIAPVMLGLLLMPFAWHFRKTSKRLRGTVCSLILLVLGVVLTTGLSGCGSTSSGYFGQKPTSYTLTITATSGNVSRSTNVTLTVQ